MPLLRYFVWVGSALLCLMFLSDAYLPKAPLRDQRDIDHSTIRIAAASSDDFVISHFAPIRRAVEIDPAEAVRKAMALMPPEEGRKAERHASHSDHLREVSQTKRKRVVQRAAHPSVNDATFGQPRQNWANNGWDNNRWSNTNWSSNSGGSNWNNGWSRDWASNQSWR